MRKTLATLILTPLLLTKNISTLDETKEPETRTYQITSGFNEIPKIWPRLYIIENLKFEKYHPT